MPASRELCDHPRRKSAFQFEFTGLGQLPSWCVVCGLGILAEVNGPDHHLDMPLGLHVTSHHAETHHRQSVPGQEGRNNGMKRSFSAGDLVGMTSIPVRNLNHGSAS